ncbi:signal peptidase I [Candidatus Wolfebacteria bacterium]|nr:signal peptidase I [Candidatus Wolfebacteria bacterium]
MKSFLINLIIYIVIIGGVVFGFPRALSWYLDTPYPMAAITSGSMWPVLKEGSLVFIQSVKKEDIKIGDIVVYRNNKGFTIHRVAELRENDLTTKGDANFQKDAPVKYEDVIGRTLTILGKPVAIPYLGMISVAANSK